MVEFSPSVFLEILDRIFFIFRNNFTVGINDILGVFILGVGAGAYRMVYSPHPIIVKKFVRGEGIVMI